jgi:hypothetical protein
MHLILLLRFNLRSHNIRLTYNTHNTYYFVISTPLASQRQPKYLLLTFFCKSNHVAIKEILASRILEKPQHDHYTQTPDQLV